ncbi:MAG: hypothetical protein R2873_07630 [Caldilineaceae bacterium]|nr:hypothetical protein [Caldilineaceae bacterium]
MAKNTKSSRQRRSKIDTGNPRSYSELIKSERNATAPAPEVKAAVATPTPTPTPTAKADNINWGTEYAQVFADLRQLLIISAALIVLMVVLGFVV